MRVIPAGRYVCVFDPLDGSSNIDCSVSIVVDLRRLQSPRAGGKYPADALQPGKDMVAAGYVLYGSACNLVLTIGGSVHGFTLDSSLGDFVLTKPKIRVPRSGAIHSVNEGRSRYWARDERVRRAHVKNKEAPHSLRYIGSMVADVHRTLMYGGTFSYPADEKAPSGKLRLLSRVLPHGLHHREGGDGVGRVEADPRYRPGLDPPALPSTHGQRGGRQRD